MDLEAAKSRHEARERALQVLYAVEVGDQLPRDACSDLLVDGDKKYLDFARNLVILAHKHKQEMDDVIKTKALHWDLGRIALMDRLILRLALCELFHLPDVPPKVTINEAIELSKNFSTDQSGRFINGILDAVLSEREIDIRRKKTGKAALPPEELKKKNSQPRKKKSSQREEPNKGKG